MAQPLGDGDPGVAAMAGSSIVGGVGRLKAMADRDRDRERGEVEGTHGRAELRGAELLVDLTGTEGAGLVPAR